MSKNLEFLKKLLYKPSGATGLFELVDGTALTPSLFSTAPTPGSTYRGLHYRVEGATGVGDSEQVIRKNSGDGYAAERMLTSRVPVLASSGNTTLTTAMSGSIMLIDGTAVSYALPAIAATEVGVNYTFFWTAASTGNGIITAQSGDLLVGFAVLGVSGANDVDYYFPNGSSHLILTANGTTTGGLAGSVARYTAINATTWQVEAHLKASGTQATPFS